MTYSSLAALAQDGQFRDRVAACAAEQETQAGADLDGLHPTAWAYQNLWQIAASPGFATTAESGQENISDGDILAAVQSRLTG